MLCPADPAARTVGPGAPVDAARLAAAAPHLAVVGVEAETDLRALGAAGLRCRAAGGPDGVLELLPQAVIARHAAGLKVGRGDDASAAARLVAARGRAARRRRGARRPAAQGPLGRPPLAPGGRPPRGTRRADPVRASGGPARGLDGRIRRDHGNLRPAAVRTAGRTHQPPEAPRTYSAAGARAERKKAGSASYSLLLKDSVIYGGGRMLQKFLTALMLPLFTAFLTKADYGIVGMVVTVTTFLDVFVTLGFDVAFTRFYFDDKSPKHRSDVITHVFYVKCLYPAVLLGRADAGHAVDLQPAHGRRRLHHLLRHRRRHAVLHQPQRPAVHAHAPGAPAVDLHHRSPSRACSSRCRWRSSSWPSSTGALPATSAPTSSRRSSSTSPRCRSTPRGCASSGTGR